MVDREVDVEPTWQRTLTFPAEMGLGLPFTTSTKSAQDADQIQIPQT
jgi:hypothetical protein